ncbi:MAG: metallophosphoesterase, partial [Microcella sp.]|nr:metallophosphoesterase [Microcella sp.]
MSRIARIAAAASLGMAAAAAVYGIAIERRAYRVRPEVIPVLSPGADSIRVLHLSDLHLAPWQHDKVAWVRSLASLDPHLIVNTGDNLGHPDALPALAEALSVFDEIPGVFVHGS